jgi:hypothetical protein
MVPGGDARYERWRHPDRFAVNPRTSVVVEGYLGSGTTWTSEVLRLANPGAVVAYHRHRAAQVAEGLRQALPVVILVRDPVDAISSILVRQPGRRAKAEVARYEVFYRACLPAADRVVVATFEQATGDVDEVIRRVNRRFGSGFNGLSSLDPWGRERVFESIRESDRRFLGPGAAMRGAAPFDGRSPALEAAREMLRDPGHARALGRCKELFWHYAALAGRRVHEDAGIAAAD